jgi:neutral trehalase
MQISLTCSHASPLLPSLVQILDFSRTVHEDLSNFDPNGAWACVLDEFVEHLRSTRTSTGTTTALMAARWVGVGHELNAIRTT